jgi:hypothetical protein
MKNLLESTTISLFLIIFSVYVLGWILNKPIPDELTSMVQVLFPMIAIKNAHNKHVEGKKNV